MFLVIFLLRWSIEKLESNDPAQVACSGPTTLAIGAVSMRPAVSLRQPRPDGFPLFASACIPTWRPGGAARPWCRRLKRRGDPLDAVHRMLATSTPSTSTNTPSRLPFDSGHADQSRGLT
jgi:hypothetical protein